MPVVAVRLALARHRSRGRPCCRRFRGRSRRSGLWDARWAMPMITVGFALAGHYGASGWGYCGGSCLCRRSSRLRHTRRAMLVIAMGFALSRCWGCCCGICSRGSSCLSRRRGRLGNTRRTMPVVAVRLTLTRSRGCRGAGCFRS